MRLQLADLRKIPKLIWLGIGLNVAYLVGTIIFYGTVQTVEGQANDFYTFYLAGRFALEDPARVYDVTAYDHPFRYLPLTAYLFAGFTLLPPFPAFVLTQVLSFGCFLAVGYLMYKIDREAHENPETYEAVGMPRFIALYLGYAPHILNYFCGQSNAILVLLLVLGLYFYAREQRGAAGLCLGASILVKPVAVLVVPLLLDYGLLRAHPKRFLRDAVELLLGTGVVVVANLVLFVQVPGLLDGYVAINFSGSAQNIGTHSSSLTRVVQLVFFPEAPGASTALFWTFLAGFYGTVVVVRLKYLTTPRHGALCFALGCLVMLLVYYDTWDHHLLYAAPFLALASVNLDGESRLYPAYWGTYVLLALYFWTAAQLVGPNFITTLFLLAAFGLLVAMITRGDLAGGTGPTNAETLASPPPDDSKPLDENLKGRRDSRQ